MKIFDLIIMGFKNLWRRKLRTFLTILGVLIGASSIIVMLSLGIALNITTEQNLKQLGDINTIQIRPNYEMRSRDSDPSITEAHLSAIEKVPGVKAVMPLFRVNGKLLSGRNEVRWLEMYGVDPTVLEEFGFKVQQGRLLTEEDSVAVLYGAEMDKSFYNSKDLESRRRRQPLEPVEIDLTKDRVEFTFDSSYGEKYADKSKKPRLYKLECAGILELGDWQKNQSVYMNLSYLKKLKQEYDRRKAKEERANSHNRGGMKRKQQIGYEEAKAIVEDYKDIPEIIDQFEEIGVQAYSSTEYIQKAKEQSSFTQAILGGIGAIALIVAAIGITNTMVMSIYERTKEIGVMKVIGAKLRDIKRIFLFEAGMIGFFGGLVGLAVSYLISFLLNKYGAKYMAGSLGGGMMMGGPEQETKISVIPIWLDLAAVGFSTLIGVISGYYPAKRAMKLSALQAIRTE